MYVEGFILPVKTARKDDYLEMSRQFAAIYREHGATRVVECWGDDLPLGERTSFPRSVELEAEETVVFSWIEYPDKATRDTCHDKVWSDPRMDEIMQHDGILDGKRMIVGGFPVVLDT